MIAHRNSLIYWLAVLSPMWLTTVERVRVGTNTVDYNKIGWTFSKANRAARKAAEGYRNRHA